VDIQIEHEVGEDDLFGLYDSVGWEAYTRSPDTLAKAIENSSIVVTARNEHGELIGLARGLSDDATIFYLQDILVRPQHQRSGVGRQLLTVCLERYSHVRQKVLLTDDDEAQQRFYESLGYVKTTNFTAAPLNAYVRFDT
jgi:ribosomal protein S18 acetylase RimI-like enzyme